MSSRPRVAFFVSGHGYGHATRAGLLLERLSAAVPVEAHVRCSAPARLFGASGAALSAGAEEPPPVQRGGLDVDWDASLKAQLESLARRAQDVAAEAAWLRSVKPALVLVDAPSLGCEAAAKAGLPSYVVSNFTWDWVFGSRAAEDPRWLPVSQRMADAYSCASGGWRLPGHGGFARVPRVEDVGLVARRAAKTRAQARAALGVPADGRALVLVSFGGYGAQLPALRAPELAAFRFMGFGPRPEGSAVDWLALDEHPARPHAEAVAACDVLLGKPGYGTFAEAAAHGCRVLYVERPDYVESIALAAWIRTVCASRALGRKEFETGDWADALSVLLKAPARPPVPADGADQLAFKLRAILS